MTLFSQSVIMKSQRAKEKIRTSPPAFIEAEQNVQLMLEGEEKHKYYKDAKDIRRRAEDAEKAPHLAESFGK